MKLLGSIFPAKSYRDAWRRGSQLARCQVNMVDEAKLRVCCAVLSRSVGLSLCDPMDIGCQAPLSRQEYWSGLLCLLQGIFPTRGWNPGLLNCRQVVYCWATRETQIRPLLLTNASCRRCSFWCTSSMCWAYSSEVTALLGFRKLFCTRLAADHQTVIRICLVQVWLWEVLWSLFSVQPLSSAQQ